MGSTHDDDGTEIAPERVPYWVREGQPPRVWLDHAGGYLIPNVRCPACGDRMVYNGNYFCESWNSGLCEWALPHPARHRSDRNVCDQLGIDYE